MAKALEGQVAFVTGGSKGIGRAIAIGLAEAGAAVALTGRGEGAGPGTAGATAAQIEAGGGRALPLSCDMRDSAAVRDAIDKAATTFGRLDILMNNAGLFFPGYDVLDIDLAQWEETIQTHVNGTFYAARFAAPHIIAGGGGSIINMSSTGGDASHDSTGNVAYSVAKAGIEQFTRGLARELRAVNVAVNAIRPMALMSEGVQRTAERLAQYHEQGTVSDEARMKQYSPPSAIVPAIVYLAQRRTEFTGNVVRRTDFDGQRFQTLAWTGTA